MTTVSGDANIYFYRELARQGITGGQIPAMTLSIGEGELPAVVIDDPMEATWIGFHLWKAAVIRARSLRADNVRDALGGLRVKAPSGFEVVMDKRNHHLHKPAVIGRITEDARMALVG